MINVFMDGDQWCALLGEDIQVGLAGFGYTPSEALRDLACQVEIYGWNF